MSIDRETGFAEVGERRPVKLEESRLVGLMRQLRNYVGLGRKREDPVRDADGLARFLDTRASFVAQTSLYGYLRTRAGMRYPELFDDDPFVTSINIAKWQIWLACLSDLAVYSGALLSRESGSQEHDVRAIVSGAVEDILTRTGVPEEAGEAFAPGVQQVRHRVAECDWAVLGDDEAAFTESPGALVEWAPIVDHLKQLDAEIVRNSVRFRWQEVRRDLRRSLDAAAVLRAGSSSADR